MISNCLLEPFLKSKGCVITKALVETGYFYLSLFSLTSNKGSLIWSQLLIPLIIWTKYKMFVQTLEWLFGASYNQMQNSLYNHVEIIMKYRLKSGENSNDSREKAKSWLPVALLLKQAVPLSRTSSLVPILLLISWLARCILEKICLANTVNQKCILDTVSLWATFGKYQCLERRIHEIAFHSQRSVFLIECV